VDKDAGGDTPDETVNDTSTNSDAGRDAVKEDDRRAGSDRDATDDRKAGKDGKDDNDNNNEGKGKGKGKGKGNGKGKDDDDEDSVEQSQEQDANSGDANQSADVINTGDNVNQCVGILQVANTGNAQNATGVTQYDSEADKIELEDGSRITLTPQLVVDCRQIILQIVKGERANETKVSNAKLREALQPRSSGAAQAARSGAGVIVPSSRSGVMSVPKVLSASSAGQPKSAAKTLPRTGGSYATLLGLSGGVLLVGGGLLVRRLSR
jgi:LPXTG-motif cell wall-anchored protein